MKKNMAMCKMMQMSMYMCMRCCVPVDDVFSQR